MKIKNSNFYLSLTLVLILSVCFAVTPSHAGSAVASGSAGTLSATGQVHLHLSDQSMPYATGFGMVEIDVVDGDFQAVEGELWASYDDGLTNNEISVVAAGGSDQVKIVFATGQIGEDPSTSDTFEEVYVPQGNSDESQDSNDSDSNDSDTDPSDTDNAPDNTKDDLNDTKDSTPMSLTVSAPQKTDPPVDNTPSAPQTQQPSDPTPAPVTLTNEEQQDRTPEEERNPSKKKSETLPKNLKTQTLKNEPCEICKPALAIQHLSQSL